MPERKNKLVKKEKNIILITAYIPAVFILSALGYFFYRKRKVITLYGVIRIIFLDRFIKTGR